LFLLKGIRQEKEETREGEARDRDKEEDKRLYQFRLP
jgi:hypothetical protein